MSFAAAVLASAADVSGGAMLLAEATDASCQAKIYMFIHAKVQHG